MLVTYMYIQDHLLYFYRILDHFINIPSSLYCFKDLSKTGPWGAISDQRSHKADITGIWKLSKDSRSMFSLSVSKDKRET